MLICTPLSKGNLLSDNFGYSGSLLIRLLTVDSHFSAEWASVSGTLFSKWIFKSYNIHRYDFVLRLTLFVRKKDQESNKWRMFYSIHLFLSRSFHIKNLKMKCICIWIIISLVKLKYWWMADNMKKLYF